MQPLNYFIKTTILVCIAAITYAEPPNLGLLKQEIRTYHDSGVYEKELSAVIDQAQKEVDQAVYENDHSAHPKKLAVVLDIDETSLSNYKHMQERDFGGNKFIYHKQTMRADGDVIQPMLAFYRHVKEEGVHVFFVTGRLASERMATVSNLKRAGYIHWAGIYFKPMDYKEHSSIPYKSGVRKAITEQGYDIVASIGDQRSDLDGGYADKTYKLPNPMYYLP